MYVKIETERLTFIRLNQTKLRSEEYIHLRDAINTDGNAQNIRPNEVDAVISAEIPNVQLDPELHEVVIKNMIHGPCGTLNQNSPCMMDGKCSKRYPRTLISETITGNDGYPLYHRRSRVDNGRTTIVKFKSTRY
ncbi:unnamed protein product [Macrosiphum euphorbiae]|uniref:DNA-directed RNA polymerase n=1 Tax=Macrosiphum euphorbiae TaxID=13131 RepID=A0AAV0YAY8_9HEMI|nr:unnamed protein product [Macrosiphum euphorbiae]